MQRTALCIESESLQHPELIGLEGENLLAQSWLQTFTDACRARSILRERRVVEEVWVVSSDSVEGINLAAALKRDNPKQEVSLVSFDVTGSIASRCDAAKVRLVGGAKDFVRLYAQRKSEADEYFGMPASAGFGDDAAHEDDGDAAVQDGIPFGDSVRTLRIEEPDWKHEGRSSLPDKHAGTNRQPASDSKAQELSDPLDRIVRTAPASSHGTFVLSVVGGSGGSGKSAIAVSAAVIYQRMGFKTVVLDSDLQFGDMAYLMGRDDALDVVELLAEPERVSRIENAEGLPAVIAAPSFLEHSEMVAGRMGDLLEYLKRFYEVIVVNTGSSWSDQQIQLIERSDTTLFVLDQRPSSIRACDHALDLCERCGIATQSFCFVLNFCSRHALLTSLDVSCALRGVSVAEIKDGGKEVAELLGAGLPQELVLSKNPFSQSMHRLCRSLAPFGEDIPLNQEGADDTQRKRGFLSVLKGRRAACL